MDVFRPSSSLFTRICLSNEMDKGAGDGGRNNNVVGRRGSVKRASGAADSNVAGMSGSSSVIAISPSRIEALRVSVDSHCNLVTKKLLSSKETVDNRNIIDTAIRGLFDKYPC